LILINGKLGLSQSGVQELFKKCKPLAKSFRALYKPFNLASPPTFSLSDSMLMLHDSPLFPYADLELYRRAVLILSLLAGENPTYLNIR